MAIETLVRKKLREAEEAFNDLTPTREAKAVFDDLLHKLQDIPRDFQSNGEVVNHGKKRVFVGMPHLVDVDCNAVMGACGRAFPADTFHTIFVHRASSLLANCFNVLWCECLSDYDCDYWLLHHADIAGQGNYGLEMVEELEAHGFDVLHTVIPIKDNFGTTSTALGTMDPWNNPRKLTFYELEKLPQTFGSEEMIDVMGREKLHRFDKGPWFMMPNTGLLLVKLTEADRSPKQWIYKFPGFTIMDRIVRMEYDLDMTVNPPKRIQGTEQVFELDSPMTPGNGERGWEVVPQVLSEDWNFGRWTFANGLKVGGTKRPGALHTGATTFTNRGVWGTWLQDEHWIHRAKRLERQRKKTEANGELHSTQPSAFAFPSNVDGWLSKQEGEALHRWAEGKKVLEIGSYCGKSTICMAQSAKVVHCIDPFDGRATPEPGDTLGIFLQNLSDYGVRDQVVEHVGTSTDILPLWNTNNSDVLFDLVFVDGAHDFASVQSDIRLATTVLAEGGLLAFHDYGRLCDPEVKLAVDNWMMRNKGAEIVELVDDVETNSHAVLIRPPKR